MAETFQTLRVAKNAGSIRMMILLYFYDEEWICSDCLLDKHGTLDCRGELKYCESCGDKETRELYYHNGKAICIDCLFRQYKRKDIYLEG